MVLGASVSAMALSIKTLTAIVVVLQVGMMLVTYKTCVDAALCPALPKLPTISNTWDSPPGNYISRTVVSINSLGLALLQFPMWMPEKTVCYPQLWMWLGVLSAFFLSVVGAVCDDTTSDSCRGNSSLHTASAVVFFIIYNMNAVILTLQKKRWRRCGLSVPLVLSLCSKVRWSSIYFPHDQTLLAVVEWSDVFLIMGWTAWFVYKERPGYEFSLQTASSPFANAPLASPIVSISLKTITYTAGCLFVGTLVSCLAAYAIQGRMPAGSWPFISETFVYQPGDLISRWALNFGGSISIFCSLGLHYLDATTYGQVSSSGWLVTGLSVIALAGMMVVGSVDESENLPVHSTAAIVAFGGYDCFMVLRTLRLLSFTQAVQNKGEPDIEYTTAASLPCVLICVVSVLLTWLRYAPHGQMVVSMLGQNGLVAPILEWLDAVSILAYFMVSILAHKGLSDATGFCITPV